ncbi:restriction endonuclease subunit S [Acinetobacter sp. YH12027]|uniref:restriction endonuclease subunit S n=1 Tax=Acinetobacter sp. YH12027 TaxID=2601043 RepID=UPI0015D219DD|nr:restriction endonuclease subunit S [Acinetobacter sp. YH12027]
MASPKLRFKEFDGNWLAATLENLAEVERGKFSVRPRNDPRYFGGEMPFVQTGDVTGSDVYLKGYSQTLNTDGIRVSKVFPADTILITIAANIGDTTITKYPVACPDSVVAIQPKREKANTIFLKNIIDLQKDNLDSQATQNAQKNINLQVLKPLELIVPSKEEQTKIASFLSAVDEKINLLTQKHELLSQYKQGMMQKLFSQQIRFKAEDGSEFGEWKQSLLGQNCHITTGKLDANAMNANGKYRFYTCAKNYFYIDNFAFDTEALLISGNGAHVGYIHYYKGKFNAYQRTYVLDGWEHNIQYVKYYLDKYLKIRINSEKKEGNTPYIVLSTLNEMPFQIPTFEEQTKIANFLSAIDQKIEVVAQQIAQTKQWKKGLLQQMFV